jgi:teichoic acid transport system permease protein
MINDIRLVFDLTRYDIKAQAKETFLGAIWLFLWPVLQSGGLIVVFSALQGGAVSRDFVLSTYIGIITWSTCVMIFIAGLQVMKTHRETITQLVFPFHLLPVVDLCSKFIFFAMQFVIAAILWAAFATVDPGVLFALNILVFVFALFCYLLAASWLASVLGIVAPDLAFALPPIFLLLLILSPIFHRTPGGLPETIEIINAFNPLVFVVRTLFDVLGTDGGGTSFPLIFLLGGLAAVLVARWVVHVLYQELGKVI